MLYFLTLRCSCASVKRRNLEKRRLAQAPLHFLMQTKRKHGFSLIELIATTSIVGLLFALIMPALQRVRESAERAQCSSNLRQLYLANVAYAQDHGHYVPAAADLWTTNLERWHGGRKSRSKDFDSSLGPLFPYLGKDKSIRRCGSFHPADKANAFESSAGGYGYNMVGVGSTAYFDGFTVEAMLKGMAPQSIQDPANTVMFSDVAFAQPYGRPEYLIEYSFTEPYRSLNGSAQEAWVTTPSIHFRHRHQANVIWCDGHVSQEPLHNSQSQLKEFDLGWLGERQDNSLFDPF